MAIKRKPLVIVLNGVSSVGKSSIAQALQKLAVRRLLHIRGDAFLAMLPPSLWGDPDGIVFKLANEPGSSSFELNIGPAVDRLMEGMRASVGALALQRNDLIVDDVMLSASCQQSYFAHAAGCEVFFVGLHAPLEVLEERERERGDRMIGLTRWQSTRIHSGISYDLELDTSVSTTEICARQIAAKFKLL